MFVPLVPHGHETGGSPALGNGPDGEQPIIRFRRRLHDLLHQAKRKEQYEA